MHRECNQVDHGLASYARSHGFFILDGRVHGLLQSVICMHNDAINEKSFKPKKHLEGKILVRRATVDQPRLRYEPCRRVIYQ